MGKSDTSKPKSYSLDGDKAFLESRAALREKRLRGELATEEPFNAKILAIEISTLQKRIDANLESGDELLKIRGMLQERQLQQDKATKAEQQKILDLLDSGKSETERAEIEYRKQLIAYGLFTAEQLNSEQTYLQRSRELSEEQYSALELLTNRHRSKLREIYNKSLTEQSEKELKTIEQDAVRRKIAQDGELANLKTLEEKKRFLQSRFSVENISAIRTSKDAEKALTDEYARENEETVRESLERQIQYYSAMMVSIQAMNPLGIAFNAEDLEKYKEIIAELEAKLAKLKSPTSGIEDEKKPDSRVDILGMTADGWDELFKNIKDGELGLDGILQVAQAIGQTFSEVNSLISTMEQREFKEYDRTQNRKKQSLDKRLKAGTISQEAYNAQVETLDKQTEQKREEMERKQAERAKALAVFQAITNTAVAVVSALGSQPFGPWNIALAAIVGALGAAQIATILATPIGFEDGGYTDVARSQDGKRFRARRSPDKRGYIDEPSILVAENGRELVVPNAGYNNPTLRPLLDLVADSISRGDIRTLDFSRLLSPTVAPGYSEGKVPAVTSTAQNSPYNSSGLDVATVNELIVAIKLLNDRLGDKTPIPAIIAMSGRNGLYQSLEKYRKEQQISTL